MNYGWFMTLPYETLVFSFSAAGMMIATRKSAVLLIHSHFISGLFTIKQKLLLIDIYRYMHIHICAYVYMYIDVR